MQAEKQDTVEGEGVPAAVDAESGGEGAPHRAAPCTISHHAVHCNTALPHSLNRHTNLEELKLEPELKLELGRSLAGRGPPRAQH